MNRFLTLVVIVALCFAFYRLQGAFLKWILSVLTGGIVAFVVQLVMALTTAYMVYLPIVVFGSLTRVASVDDIFILLQARPSDIGGVGILGAVLGVIFGLFTFLHWNPYANQSGGVIQGRHIQYETFGRRISVIGFLRGIVQRNIKK